MTEQSLQTVYTVLDCLAVLPILWIAYYAAAAIFTKAARITCGRGGGIIFTLCIAWLAVRYLGVIA